MSKVKRFLINRLDERSTWRAIVALITVAGITLTDVQMEAIVVAGVAIGALLEAFLPDPAGRIREPADDIDFDELDDDELRTAADAVPAKRKAGAREPQGRVESNADRGRSAWLD
jgi:hypothetical protein